MIQKHSIVLWKDAENSTMTFEEISRRTFDFIESLKKTSQFSCLYINKAANIYEELPNTFDSFCKLLKSTYLDASIKVCCSHKVIAVGFHPLYYDASVGV